MSGTGLKARVRRLEHLTRHLLRRVLVTLPGGAQQDGKTGQPWAGGTPDIHLNFDFQPMTPAQIDAARAEVNT